jgi:hypothetical protein
MFPEGEYDIEIVQKIPCKFTEKEMLKSDF